MGIPITTYSDANGFYEIPWRYSIGTIMGTKAKNNRVNIKPLDTHGTFIRNLYTLITQFIVGSVHIEGFVSSCQMRDGYDFNFNGHTQVRYWSQILNSYFFHDEFSDNEGITRAPSKMVCYAQWGNTGRNVDLDGIPNFGNASTPMLGHIPILNTPQSLIVQYFLKVFDGRNITNYPNLFNLLTGLLPDMTIRVPQAQEPQFYNSRLTQISLHEISHASHYNRVGNIWWLNFINTTVGANPVAGNPYGNVSDYTDVGESWAEFLGTNFTQRRYAAANCVGQATNTIGTITARRYFRMDNLVENEFWFFGGQWIPYGCYNDLIDGLNAAEPWDVVQGVSIQQLFNAHNSNVTGMCGYRANFNLLNPTINQVDLNVIFDIHRAFCR